MTPHTCASHIQINEAESGHISSSGALPFLPDVGSAWVGT